MAHIRRLPPTGAGRGYRYQVRYLDGRDVERARTFPTRDEATRFKADVEIVRRSGGVIAAPTHLTVTSWSERFVQLQEWRESTTIQQESRLRSHILPTLGALRLEDVSLRDLRSLVRGWERSSMSPATVRACTSLVRSMFAAAVDEDVLHSSPATELRSRPSGGGRRRSVLSLAAVVALRGEMPTETHRLFLDVLAGTGMRMNEARSLTIDRLDLDSTPPSITVDRQLLPGRATTVVASFGPVKGKSIPSRTIGITAPLAAALRAHVAGRPGSAFVFESSHFAGHALGGRSLTEVWQRAADRAKVDRVAFPGWHSLRHHHASQLLSSRAVSVAAVQHRLGHSSAAVTLGVYTHAWETGESQILAVLDGSDGSDTP